MRPYFETSLGSYYLGDNIEILDRFPTGTFSITITDPPYFDNNKHGVGTYEAYRKLLPQLSRVMRQNSWLIVYFPSNRLDILLRDTTEYFEYVDRFIVQFQSTTAKGVFGDKTTLELCVFRKGRPKLAERFYTDILPGIEDPSFITLHPKNPMWKPTLATALILRKFLGEPKNQTILDPFAGNGSIVLVAEKLGYRWVGVEVNPTSAEVARKIVAEGVSPREALKQKEANKNATPLDGWLEVGT